MRTKDPRIVTAIVTGLLGVSTLTVAAQSEETPLQPPVEFTGSWCTGPAVSADRAGAYSTLDLGDEGMTLTRYQGGAWRNSVEASDPRLQGEAFQTWESDTYEVPGAPTTVEVDSSTLSIVNEAGTWTSAGYGGTYPDGTAMGNGPTVLIGAGEYAGLVAFMSMDEGTSSCSDIRGIIVDRPPVPEPYLPD